jgi:hypothetical protein
MEENVVEKCPNCSSTELRREVYKLPDDFSSFSLDKTLAKWHLDHIIEITCRECGQRWNE